jgi:predicted transglutaminase-like cysteine proteinase
MQAPRGYEEMCRSHPEWCMAANGDGHAPITPPSLAASAHASNKIDAVLVADLQPTPFALDIMPSLFSLSPSLLAARRSDAVSPYSGRLLALVELRKQLGIDRIDAPPGEALATLAPDMQAMPAMPPIQVAQADEAPAPPAIVATGGIEASVHAANTRTRHRTVGPDVALLQRINRKVNGRVAQRQDIAIFGQGEVWRRSGIGTAAVGDCEDLAIEKRLQLIAEGFPPTKLAYAVVYDRRLGLHTVLIARTEQGDVVLDSATPYVTAWNRTRYSWISVQAMEDPQRWLSVGRAQAA